MMSGYTRSMICGKANLFNRGISKILSMLSGWKTILIICNPNKHIHVAQLLNGTRTKNRSLTACALGFSLLALLNQTMNANFSHIQESV
jgi:hypothetical protein